LIDIEKPRNSLPHDEVCVTLSEMNIESPQSSHYSYTGEDELIAAILDRLGSPERFAIDIAAGDGMHMSNTLKLFEQGWSGLAVEWDGRQFSRLAERYRAFPDVRLARCKVQPAMIRHLLKGYSVPQRPGVLSLDIDSYDHAVLQSLWDEFRPSIVCAEINEKIPPPVRFTVLFDPAHVWATDHFYGQSLAQLCQLARSYEYVLVALEFNNAFLVPAELAAHAGIAAVTAEEAYRRGYLDRPERHRLFPWNANLEYLHGLPPDRVAQEIRAFFGEYAGKFVCDV
jgi:hypothetical protein